MGVATMTARPAASLELIATKKLADFPLLNYVEAGTNLEGGHDLGRAPLKAERWAPDHCPLGREDLDHSCH